MDPVGSCVLRCWSMPGAGVVIGMYFGGLGPHAACLCVLVLWVTTEEVLGARAGMFELAWRII